MRALRGLVAVVTAFSAVVATGAVAAAAESDRSYVCSGGNIPSGTYSSVRVTGFCYVPSGLVRVEGNLTIARGALLDAMTPAGFPVSPANLPGIVQVEGNVNVGENAVLILGCDLAILCSPGNSTYPGPPGLYPSHPELGFSNPGDIVGGNIVGDGALAVIVHSVKIEGNASLNGGGGGPIQLTGGPGSGACFDQTLVPFPPAWSATSLAHIPPTFGGPFPVYTDFEENSIGGNLVMKGLQTCWMGALRNKVGGNLVDLNNTFGDPDANEVLGNIVEGNIACAGNNSVVQFGDSGGMSNIVSGKARGECGFNVIDPIAKLPISVKAPESE
jgi:hypothetical protein